MRLGESHRSVECEGMAADLGYLHPAVALIGLPDLRGCCLVTLSIATILLTEIIPEHLKQQVV